MPLNRARCQGGSFNPPCATDVDLSEVLDLRCGLRHATSAPINADSR